MPLVRDEAVCVRVWDWSETSQTVSIFTRAGGLVRGVAKGAKREQGAFAGGFELATRGEVVYSDRAKDKGGAGLATIASWDLVEIYPHARASLLSFHTSMAMLDLTHQAVQEYDPHPALYDALATTLRELGSARSDRLAVLRVAWSVLADTGHAPELFADVREGNALAEAASYDFLPRLGGFSRSGSDAGDGGVVWRVRGETLKLLRVLAASPPLRGVEAFDDATLWRAAKLLMLHVREVFQVRSSAVDALIAYVEAQPTTPAATSPR